MLISLNSLQLTLFRIFYAPYVDTAGYRITNLLGLFIIELQLTAVG